jgi:hypothetical protein
MSQGNYVDIMGIGHTLCIKGCFENGFRPYEPVSSHENGEIKTEKKQCCQKVWRYLERTIQIEKEKKQKEKE